MSIWCNFEFLDKAAELRGKLRLKGRRLAFDCVNMRAMPPDRAHCSEGYRVGRAQDGSTPVATILLGATPTVCKDCTEFHEYRFG